MTTTVIDQLVVELGLDPAKFTQGQKDAIDSFKKTNEAATAVGNQIESQGKRVTEYFSNLKREALTLVAVFLGGKGIKEFTSYVFGLDAAVGRLAPQLSMSTRELSAWQGAMKQNGGSAEAMTASMAGLTGEMNKFMLTGQASFLPVLNRLGIGLFDANKNLKTSSQMFLEIADAVKDMDPARAAAFLSMIPGMNQDTINLLVQGRKAVEGYLEAARKSGLITEQDAIAAKAYQQQLSLLDASATSLGRTLLTTLAPALVTVFNAMTRLIQGWNIKPGSAQAKALDQDVSKTVRGKLGSPRAFIEWLMGPKIATELYGSAEDEQRAFDESQRGYGAPDTATTPGGGVGPRSATEQEAYIRQAAKARGIDPDVAVAVARSEGLNKYIGDQGTSFGPFQLHYKNSIPGLSNSGLGDKFTAQTGKHASDPSTWKDQVDFALDEAKKSGWGAWHGWRGLPNAGLGGGPVGAGGAGAAGHSSSNQTNSTTITVGKIEVNSSKAGASEVASEIPAALKRMNWAASANYGQTG